MNIQVDQEFKNLITPLSSEERTKLEESILSEGCRDSLITWNGFLIDGHNRYEICSKHGLSFNTIEKELPDRQAVKNWMITNQLGRRNLTPEKFRYMIGKLYESKTNQGKRTDLTSGHFDQKSTSEEISQEYKIGEKTVRRSAEFSKAIDIIAKNSGEEAKEKILNREIDMTQQEVIEVSKLEPVQQKEVLKELEQEEGKTWRVPIKSKIVEAEIRKKELFSPPIPEGKFNVIYADPPWSYEFSETTSRDIKSHYPTMELEEIKELKVSSADDAVLFLWTTAPKLEESFEVLSSWGFKYRTCAVWDKEIIGMGYWFRGQHELLLVGVKGSFPTPAPDSRFSSVIKEKRGKHSKKPDKIYDMLEEMFPHGKFLELFARENKRPKWTVWGNQCE